MQHQFTINSTSGNFLEVTKIFRKLYLWSFLRSSFVALHAYLSVYVSFLFSCLVNFIRFCDIKSFILLKRYWWDDRNQVVVVSQRKLHRTEDVNSSFNQLDKVNEKLLCKYFITFKILKLYPIHPLQILNYVFHLLLVTFPLICRSRMNSATDDMKYCVSFKQRREIIK